MLIWVGGGAVEHKATQERSAAFSDGSGLSRQRSELYQSDGGMPAGHPHLGNLQIADDIQWELLKQSQVPLLLIVPWPELSGFGF